METRRLDTGKAPSDADRATRQPAIELRHLRYFVAVCEELHFGRAAERLHIAQPPLSQAIRRLEDELGALLLNRTSRVVTLTAAGHVLAEEARNVIASFDRAIAEARRAGGIGSPIRVGCVPYIPIERLLSFLSALEEHDPSLQVEVSQRLSLEQVRLVRNGELDLGLLYHVEEYDGLELEPLFGGDAMTAYLPLDHDLAKKDVLGPGDLRDEDLVMFNRDANPALHDHWLASLEDAGYSFRSVRDVGGALSARDLMLAVSSGFGVALASFALTEVTEVARLVTQVRLDPAPSMPNIVLAFLEKPPRQLSATLADVREVARSLSRKPDDDASG